MHKMPENEESSSAVEVQVTVPETEAQTETPPATAEQVVQVQSSVETNTILQAVQALETRIPTIVEAKVRECMAPLEQKVNELEILEVAETIAETTTQTTPTDSSSTSEPTPIVVEAPTVEENEDNKERHEEPAAP